jgi:spoIIIJ-associated protein
LQEIDVLEGKEIDPRKVLLEVVRLMGFEVEVKEAVEDERVLLVISGPEASQLIGKKGQTLDALQFLINRMVGREDSRKPIVIDSDGYRERRNDALVQLAHRLSEKAIRSAKIVAVNPMSAHDRRVIHMALKDMPGVSTRSEGEGSYRRLLIVPESTK